MFGFTNVFVPNNATTTTISGINQLPSNQNQINETSHTNSINPIIIQASIDAGYAILISAGLSFIGLGAQPPEVEWGLLITQSRAQFLNHWWTITFPGTFIILTVLSFNIIGDGLRDILNPKIAKE